MSAENIISSKNLCFSYEQGKEILKEINIDIKRGEFTALLGHNGSGKSTFARLTNAILVPTKGSMNVFGMDTSDEGKLYDIRQNVGMVFQNPDNQIVAAVVEEDVAFGLENTGVPPAEIRERVDEALKAAALPDGAVELAEARAEARRARNFAESDRLRDQLAAMGVAVEDLPGGKYRLSLNR